MPRFIAVDAAGKIQAKHLPADAAAARAALGAGTSNLGLGTTATTAAAGNHGHTSAAVSDFAEAVQDAVAAMVVAGANVTKTYDDAAGTLTINASGGGAGTTDPEVVRDTIGGALVGGANINITVNDVGDTLTIAVTGLTKADVGLSNVDNTTDAAKPISNATATALAGKASTAHTHPAGDLTATGTKSSTTFLRGDNTWAVPPTTGGGGTVASTGITDSTTVGRAVLTAVDAPAARTAIGAGTSNLSLGTTPGTAKAGDYAPTKADVGLASVDNTADVDKPVSTAQAAALAAKAPLASPAFTGTVTGIDRAMVGLNLVNNTTDLGKPVSTATQTALNLKANLASPTFTGTVGGITKAMVGLGNVDNTADASKPVSTAQQTALDAKANLLTTTTSQAAAYTLGLTDVGTVVEYTGAAAATFTVPANATTALPVNGTIVVRQYGTGQLTLAGAAGATLRSRGNALRLAGQYSEATLTKRSTDEWIVSGDVIV